MEEGNGQASQPTQEAPQPAPAPGGQMPAQTDGKPNGLAIGSLVLGILSLLISVWGGFVLGIVGIILGAIALKKIKEDPSQTGRGMAIAGIVLGVISIVVMVLVVSVFGALFFGALSTVQYY